MKKFTHSAILYGSLSAQFCLADPINGCDKQSEIQPKWNVLGEYLFWKVEQDDMDYGKVLTTRSANYPESIYEIVCADFHYDFGFRLGIDCESVYEDYDLGLVYTYIPTTSSTCDTSNGSATLTSIFTIYVDSTVSAGTNIPLSKLTSHWKSNVNQMDLDAGRTLKFGKCFSMRPHLGFRSIWGDQHFTVTSTFLDPIPPHSDTSLIPPPGTTTNITKFKQDYFGCGVEGGLWADFDLCYGISILGHVGGSILYSRFSMHNSFEDAIVTKTKSTTTNLVLAKDVVHSATPTTEYFVGLMYDYADQYEGWSYVLNAHLGWEQHIYFDMNNLQVGGDVNGNLSTQGLTAGLDLRF